MTTCCSRLRKHCCRSSSSNYCDNSLNHGHLKDSFWSFATRQCVETCLGADCSFPVHENCAARPGAEHEGEMFGASMKLWPFSGLGRAKPILPASFIGPPRPEAIRIALWVFCSGGRITVHAREQPCTFISFWQSTLPLAYRTDWPLRE